MGLGATLKVSARGELEITDLNCRYLELGALELGRGFTWFDSDAQESLLGAANFVEQVELRQGLTIACPEEVAYPSGLIYSDDMLQRAEELRKSRYCAYLPAFSSERSAQSRFRG